MFDITLLWEVRGLILQGFWNTLWICFTGCLMALSLGLVLAALRLANPRLFGYPVACYVELCRGTPLLILLFLLYYGGPALGITLDAIPAGLIGLGVYSSVYFAEIFRTGFNSIPPGQLEAAECLGLSRLQVIRRIQLPQMLVLILPALVNMVTILCKETPVLSIITVPELTLVLSGIGSQTFAFAEVLLALCLGYLALVEATSRVGQALERRAQRYLGTRPVKKTLQEDIA